MALSTCGAVIMSDIKAMESVRGTGRKGVSLPLNFIIIAAILVIVLVVVLAIFGERAAIFTESTSQGCPSGDRYGSRSDAQEHCGPGETVVYRPHDAEDNAWCCLSTTEVTQ